MELIEKHKNIESILKNVDKEKYPPPENWNYEGARNLFLNPEITDPETLEVIIHSEWYSQVPK